jgi:hypothetical protein
MNLDWGLIIGALLTVFVLTYLIGDNFLFRLAVYILIGASAAYAAVVVIFDVLIPRIQQSATNPGMLVVTIVALLLGGMLLFKVSPRLAWLGNLPVGYLVGVGAATVLGGAIIGTLGPQIVATGAPATTVSGLPVELLSPNAPLLQESTGWYVFLTFLTVIGTIVTLLSFGYYRTQHNVALQVVNVVGRRFFVMVALGATFALVFMASATLLFDRLYAIYQAVQSFPPFGGK